MDLKGLTVFMKVGWSKKKKQPNTQQI